MQHRVQVALIAAAGTLLLSGCAPAVPSPSTSPLPARSLTSSPSIKTTDVRILSGDQIQGTVSLPWKLREVNGRQLTISYVAGGGCTVWKGFRVVENARSVELRASAATSTDPEQDCGATLDGGNTVITLREPLADRHLLHAPVDEGWAGYSRTL